MDASLHSGTEYPHLFLVTFLGFDGKLMAATVVNNITGMKF
jgi:hypothetical protein